jgi:ribosomal protein S18 acetylase RimI-like enzyme
MPQITYTTTDGKELELITPLREKIRQYHVERSTYFKERITEISVEEANKQLRAKASGGILLDLVRDGDTGNLVGYCLTSINEERRGEIVSIYLEPGYRRQRIGYKLMERALDWMDKHGVKRKMLSIGAGNEEVVDFYRNFNFEVRSIIMEQVETGFPPARE